MSYVAVEAYFYYLLNKVIITQIIINLYFVMFYSYFSLLSSFHIINILFRGLYCMPFLFHIIETMPCEILPLYMHTNPLLQMSQLIVTYLLIS